MSAPTVGSLFTGCSGLEMGIREVFPSARTLWHCEDDPATKKTPKPRNAAARLLAHHYPDVPNLGDITRVDWTTVPRPTIACGGFPCQDISVSGKQLGLAPGTRSGLWTHMAYAIGALQPRLVLIENVGGLLSARAHSDVEPCPWCVGDAGGEPALRALGAVLADLAELGYDACWTSVRASDVGAPHGRRRVFVLAWPAADPDRVGREWSRAARDGGLRPEDSGRSPAAAHAGCDARPEDDPDEHPAPGRRRDAATDSCSCGLGPDFTGLPARESDPAGSPVADATGDRRDERRTEPARVLGGPDVALGGADAPADPHRDAVRQQPVPESRSVGAAEPRRAGVEWGPYGAAVARWERVLGRPAPAPTEPSRTGGQRLSPRFVEHMMGLPDGWVTGVPGISRNDQLKMLGNGVVPQQAAEALRRLLNVAARVA